MVETPAPSAARPARVDRVALVAGSLGTHITAALAPVLDESLIDTTIICVLCALERAGPLRPRDVQVLTSLTSGGTTNLLDRLATLDLVVRSHDAVAGDRRAVVVTLTPAGRRTVDAVAEVFAAEAGAIRSFLAELDAALGGTSTAPAPARSGGAPSTAPRAAAPDDGAEPPSAEAFSRGAVLDAVIGLAQLGFALRRALVAGLHPEVYMENPVAIVLGALLEGGPRRPRDLQPLLGLTSGGTTKLLARIERSGLIALDRRRLEADRRATIVSITARGRRAMAAADASLAARTDEVRAIIRQADTDLAG